MKTLILIALSFPGFAFAHDAAIEALIGRAEAAQESYSSLLRFRDQQMNTLQTDLGELYKITGGKKFDYNTYSGPTKFKVDNLQAKISSVANSIPGKSFDMPANAVSLENQTNVSRAHYMKALRELSTVEGAEKLKLKPEIAQDLKFARATQDLSANEFSRALKSYEGRKFGKFLGSDAAAEAEFKTIDLRGAKQVKVDTYHSQAEVTIKPGQQLRITTPSGDLVSGKVIGTYPDGRVLVQGEMPFGLESEFPELGRGRILNLSEASDVKIYNQGSEKPVEVSVRYTAGNVRDAVRQNKLWDLSNKPKANGEVAEIDPIRASIVDKRAGENVRGNYFGPGGSFR